MEIENKEQILQRRREIEIQEIRSRQSVHGVECLSNHCIVVSPRFPSVKQAAINAVKSVATKGATPLQ